jgi:ABC-type transporter Mla maintaining outer membrane lipid asymmetry permease subunit MlaE
MPVIVNFFEWFGEFGSFCARLARTAFVPPYERQEFLRQLDEVGAKSLLLVALAGAATGVVLLLGARDSPLRFGAKPLLPAVIVISIIKESGPTRWKALQATRCPAPVRPRRIYHGDLYGSSYS